MNNKDLKRRILFLALKMQEGTITDEEKKEFELWYNSFDDSFFELQTEEDKTLLKERIYNSIENEITLPKNKSTIFKSPLLRVAAAIIIGLISVFLYRYNYSNKTTDAIAISTNDIPAGEQKAVLILSDGSKVNLDGKQKDGLLSVEGTEIKRTKGQLVYAHNAKDDQNAAPVYHTIQIPRGGTYMLNLPDGTKVWLNAASSLRYPTEFKGNTREVELTGEAYFEVAKNKNKPFIVKNEKLNVEVLGTHFNINAYPDEKEIKTTLFEGKVKVLLPKGNVFLEPMQQAIVNASNQAVRLKKVDNMEAISWKEGYFVFDNEPITSVMNKISRWYDVEIVYKDGIPKQGYIGKISRYENVSEALKMLSLTKTIHFQIEGRRIFVMN